MESIIRFLPASFNNTCYINDEIELCRIGNIDRLKEMEIKDPSACIFIASNYEHTDIIKYLIINKINSENKHKFINTLHIVLYQVALDGIYDMIDFFIDIIEDMEIIESPADKLKSYCFSRLVHGACKRNDTNVLKYLLDEKCVGKSEVYFLYTLLGDRFFIKDVNVYLRSFMFRNKIDYIKAGIF